MLVTKQWCELCMNCDVLSTECAFAALANLRSINRIIIIFFIIIILYNLPVFYLYCNSFFIRDVMENLD